MTVRNQPLSLSAIQAQRLELQAVLEDVVGESFAFAKRAERWTSVAPDGAPPSSMPAELPAAVIAALEEQFSSQRQIVSAQGPTTHLVVLPAPSEDGAQWAIWSLVPDQNARALQRLIKSARLLLEERRTARELKSCLKECAQQVTADFEELSWLRDLAAHIDICDVNHDVIKVAQAVLPSLRDIIGAECILLFRKEMADASLSPTAVRKYEIGELLLSDQACIAIIEQLGAAALRQPIVRNASFFGKFFPHEATSLRSFMLTRVGRGEDQFGWLLAINKRISTTDHEGDVYRDAKSCGEGEFGTFEAALLNAAAVLLGTHNRNLTLFRAKEDLFLGITKALINSLDAKDSYTWGHSERVARMAKRIAAEMQLSAEECERIYLTGLLHDIGKIGVPDQVLLKPAKLTDEEFALIKKHPEIGYNILKHVAQLHYVLPGVLHHHESYDGRGYPHGLRDEAIPIFGRILAVADAYDAMTSNRPYRPGMATSRAEEILRSGAGQQWDPNVVEAFFQIRADMHQICRIAATGMKASEGPGGAFAPALPSGLVPDSIAPAMQTLVPI